LLFDLDPRTDLFNNPQLMMATMMGELMTLLTMGMGGGRGRGRAQLPGRGNQEMPVEHLRETPHGRQTNGKRSPTATFEKFSILLTISPF